MARLWSDERMRKAIAAAPSPQTFQALTDDASGALLIATRAGIARLIGESVELPPGRLAPVESAKLLLDRDDALWIGAYGPTGQLGLLHVRGGKVDTFEKHDGLSGSSVWAMFEDREGNVWVATDEGLDRFRGTPESSATRRYTSMSFPLGASVVPGGVNFSVCSRQATGIELLLFESAEAAQPTEVIELDPHGHRSYYYWHVFVPRIRAGARTAAALRAST